jgi:hypothetical protein
VWHQNLESLSSRKFRLAAKSGVCVQAKCLGWDTKTQTVPSGNVQGGSQIWCQCACEISMEAPKIWRPCPREISSVADKIFGIVQAKVECGTNICVIVLEKCQGWQPKNGVCVQAMCLGWHVKMGVSVLEKIPGWKPIIVVSLEAKCLG